MPLLITTDVYLLVYLSLSYNATEFISSNLIILPISDVED